jgi:hypothetical protein
VTGHFAGGVSEMRLKVAKLPQVDWVQADRNLVLARHTSFDMQITPKENSHRQAL